MYNYSMSITSAYNNLVHQKAIKPYTHQLNVVTKLQRFDDKIGLFSKWHGIYLHGEVGRGKSFLMNLYLNNSRVKNKTRLHFHDFMYQVHNQLNELNNKRDSISMVSKLLAKKYKLIILDELYIKDIANAMILSRLFQTLFDNKVYLLITSNHTPEMLYHNGLQRENFLPAIHLIEKKMEIINIGGEIDYRLIKHNTNKYFINDINSFQRSIAEATGGEKMHSQEITASNRQLAIPNSIGKVVKCSFDWICQQNLTASDYRAIAKHFHTIFLSNIHTITDRNEIARFMIFIDELYENQCNLFCLAVCTPELICNKKEFERTYSRIIEMCSN